MSNESDYDYLKRLAYELAYGPGLHMDAFRLRNIISVHREALKTTTTLSTTPLVVRVCPNRQEK